MPANECKQLWRILRGLAGPMLLLVFGYLTLREPLRVWLHVEETYDQETMHEWIKEAVVSRLTLPELVGKFQQEVAAYVQAVQADPDQRGLSQEFAVTPAHVAVKNHLKALGTPPTKMYAGQLPLFPLIFRLEVRPNPNPGAFEWMNA